MDSERAELAISLIDPTTLHFTEWLAAGMALHHEGASLAAWEAWSRRDPKRYKEGDCAKRWKGFKDSGEIVTIGTLINLAKKQGANTSALFTNDDDAHYDFDTPLPRPGQAKAAPKKLVDAHYLVRTDVPKPEKDWHKTDFARYIRLMFQADEKVGIVADSWERDGKHLPTKGVWDRTAGRLIELAAKYKGDTARVIGDTDPGVGAWVRINPLDGNGCSDENVTEFRHALLESDVGDLGTQLAIIRKLEIPCTCIVHSGGKSIHALVKIDAPDYETYKKRVAFLFDVATREGLTVDSGNRNPSRLSRLPGVTRNGNPQYIIAEKTGKATWTDWEEFIVEALDDLPDPVEMPYDLDKLPKLDPELISGVLRTGAKMILTGPSKAGKSIAMQEIATAIANGIPWFGHPTMQGDVIYINGEIEEKQFMHRMNQIYRAMGGTRENYSRIKHWPLRGLTLPLNKLAPKLIRRVKGTNTVAIIIDPTYKVMPGDENDAQDVGNFCNLLDQIVAKTGAAIFYVHHHSKGQQGFKKAQDRSSGSGVFTRDGDAIIDMIELEVIRGQRDSLRYALINQALRAFADRHGITTDQIDDADRKDNAEFKTAIERIRPAMITELNNAVAIANETADDATGWRVEYTLRSFRPKQPHNLFYTYPIHRSPVFNDTDVLATSTVLGEQQWKKVGKSKGKKNASQPEEKDHHSEPEIVVKIDHEVERLREAIEKARSELQFGEVFNIAYLEKKVALRHCKTTEGKPISCNWNSYNNQVKRAGYRASKGLIPPLHEQENSRNSDENTITKTDETNLDF